MNPENLTCPHCGGGMTPRLSASGKFWGCNAYPKCRGTRDVMGEANTRFQSDTVRRGGDEDASMPSDRWRQRDRKRWE